jgi:competence protein ComEC
MNVRHIDVLFVSHADLDHVNGLPGLIERFSIGRVIASPVVGHADAGRGLLALLDARGIPHETAQAGDRVEFGDGNVIEVLAPLDWTLRRYPNEQNANSLVVRASCDGRSVLLAGDIEDETALVLRRAGVALSADVLLVPHHGCAMAGAVAFARAVSPCVAICSNRADHLSAATVAAYRKVGVDVFATCWSGAITVRLGDGEAVVGTFLRTSREGRPTVPGTAGSHK